MRAEADNLDRRQDFVALQYRLAQRSAREVPEADRSVPAAGDQEWGVWMEGNGSDRITVVERGPHRHAGSGVPEPGRAVVAGGEDASAIGAEANRADPVAVAQRLSALRAGLGIPEP